MEAKVKNVLKNIKGSLEAVFAICEHAGLTQLFNFWLGLEDTKMTVRGPQNANVRCLN